VPTWAWILIAIAAVVFLAVVAVAALASRRRARTARLQERFGPEYDRAVDSTEDRREAEAELEQRVKRRQELDIRPLTPAARERYATSWRDVQAQFVDAPGAAIAAADGLIIAVMRERGYPVDDFEQRAADVSVDHPRVVENYRAAHDVAGRCARGEASTEDLRQGMQHYRALFEDLLERDDDEALARDRDRDTEDVDVATDGRTIREVTR
jgi:hypothetical protein